MREITPEIIFEAVALEMDITKDALLSREGKKSTFAVAKGKQLSAYLLRLYSDITLKEIATLLGFEDKGYAQYCIKKTINAGLADMEGIALIEAKMWKLTREPREAPPPHYAPVRKGWLDNRNQRKR